MLPANAWMEVIRSLSIPKQFVSDSAKMEMQGKFGCIEKEYKIEQRSSEASLLGGRIMQKRLL
jgi:hypothetical protein